MSDSIEVLSMVKVVYTIYAISIISVFAWFGFKLTTGKPPGPFSKKIFFAYIVLLVFAGVSIHDFMKFSKVNVVISRMVLAFIFIALGFLMLIYI